MANDGMGSGLALTHGNGVGAGMTVRGDGFGGTSLARQAETASTALAEAARAEVEARFKVALARPRDLDEVRVRILKECRRPGFAEVARYSLPRGGKRIEGPSIRLAEVCARYMGNLLLASPVIYEDDEKRIARCSVTDLETNATYVADVTVSKTVERHQAEPSEVIGARMNSQGKTVYLVRASDDALLQKHNALVSKALRTLIFRVVPGDIVDEAEEVVVATLRNRDSVDPDTQRKRLVDAFASLNVLPTMLREYLGHDVGTASPAEITELRQLYVSLKDGEATWPEVMKARKGETSSEAEGDGKAAPTTRTGRAKAAAASAAAKARGEEPKREEPSKIDPETGEVDEADLPPIGEPD